MRARRRVSSPASTARSDVILDSGVLIALYSRDDPLHASATRWLADFHGALHTIDAVLTETAFFLPPRQREALADLAARGQIVVHHPDTSAYARMGQLMRKFADQDPDWADMGLVWLAEVTRIVRIATVDITDFSVYRIHGRRRFEFALLR